MEERYYLGCRMVLMLEPRYESSEGRRNIVARFTIRRKRTYIRIGDPVTCSEWDAIASSKRGELYSRKVSIVESYRMMCAEAEKILRDGGDISSLRYVFSGRRSEMIADHVRAMVEDMGYNSRRKHESTLRRFTAKFGEKCCFNDITTASIKSWDALLVDEGISSSTRRIYLATSQRWFSHAVEVGILRENPFKSFRLPRDTKRRDRYVGVETWGLMYGFLYNRSAAWLLTSYLCNGCNPADLATMRYTKRYFRSGGTELEFTRKKTEHVTPTTVVIPLIEPLKVLMRKLAATPVEGALVFPQISHGAKSDDEQKKSISQFCTSVNKGLKTFARDHGLDERLSFTFARHSFKTNLMLAGVPETYTEQAIGHVDNSVAGFYRGFFTHDDMFRYNSLLLPENCFSSAK